MSSFKGKGFETKSIGTVEMEKASQLFPLCFATICSSSFFCLVVTSKEMVLVLVVISIHQHNIDLDDKNIPGTKLSWYNSNQSCKSRGNPKVLSSLYTGKSHV